MAIDTRRLAQIGIHISARELEKRIEAALEDVIPAQLVSQPAGELSSEETEALTRGGLDLAAQSDDESDSGTENALVRSAAEYAALLAASYTVAEAARLLRVDSSRIRQRLASRTLYGIRRNTGWLLPAFQFDGHSLLLNIDRVLPHLDPHLSPLTVVRWFTTPDADLTQDSEETPTSPRDWLYSGGSPEVVVALAQELGVGL